MATGGTATLLFFPMRRSVLANSPSDSGLHYTEGVSSQSPRVARHELPWERKKGCLPQRGYAQQLRFSMRRRKGRNPVGVDALLPIPG